ncbi:hypothetical protein ACC674_37260 [Rhizobium ruizarguesonis]
MATLRRLADRSGDIATSVRLNRSDANRAAILFPIRVLQLAEEAGRKGERLTFSDYDKLVAKLS